VLRANPLGSSVVVGPGVGKDAAAIAIGERIVVAKNDPITFASEKGATHLIEVNANDIACMGAIPRWVLVTALLPVGITPGEVLNQFAELNEACRQRSVELVGGHTEVMAGIDRPILVGMMLGDVAPEDLIQPGNATAGDALMLTQGLAIEGTALLARELRPALEASLGSRLIDSAASMIDDPGISVVQAARLATKSGGVTALHDPTEGGLATAVRELALVSGAGVELDQSSIPIFAETRAIARELGLDPLGVLASGALLIAARHDAASNLVQSIESSGIPVSVIGRLTGDPNEFVLNTPTGTIPLPEFDVDEVARVLSSPIYERSRNEEVGL
jgi:hydrogenase maturation factor